jgi:hypothetical protein
VRLKRMKKLEYNTPELGDNHKGANSIWWEHENEKRKAQKKYLKQFYFSRSVLTP